jgi:hypothetical protein
MPNHVYNKLKIKGPKTELDKIKKDAKEANEKFSIRKLYPMPQDLEKTSSPPNILKTGEYLKEMKKIKENPEMDWSRPLTKKQSEELIKKFGVNNWYDWALINWGTKWGSYSSALAKEGKTYLKYEFDTAWGPPIIGLRNISEIYPKLSFELKYEEEGMGFKGWAIIEGGNVIDEEESDYN